MLSLPAVKECTRPLTKFPTDARDLDRVLCPLVDGPFILMLATHIEQNPVSKHANDSGTSTYDMRVVYQVPKTQCEKMVCAIAKWIETRD